MVHIAMRFGTGDLDPHFYRYPSLPMYLLSLVYALGYLLGRAAGWWSGPETYVQAFATDPSGWFMTGRLLVALASGGLVWVTGWLGHRWFGSAAGLSAAWLVAVSPLQVREAHALRPEVWMVFAGLLTLVVAARLAEAGDPRSAILAGGAAGLAAGLKWSGILWLAPVIAAAWRGPRRGRLAMVASAAAGAAAILSTPALLWHPGAVLRDVCAVVTDIGQRSRVWQEAGWLFYPQVALPWALGAAGCAAALAGLLRLRDRPVAARLLLAALVPWCLLLSGLMTTHIRYALPVIPLMAVLAGAGLAWLGGWLWPARGGAACGLLTIVVAASPAWTSVALARLFAATDTRVEAAQWIERHVAPGARIALTGLVTAPSLWPTEEQISKIEGPGRRFVKAWRRALETGRRPTYHLDILQDRDFWCRGVDASDAAALRRHGVGVVVLDDSPLVRFERRREGLESLARTGRLIAEFSPFAEAASGPLRWPRYDQWDAFFIPLEGYSRFRAGGPVLRVYDVRGMVP